MSSKCVFAALQLREGRFFSVREADMMPVAARLRHCDVERVCLLLRLLGIVVLKGFQQVDIILDDFSS